MKAAAAMLVVLAFFSCGKKFSVRDRYEGVKDGVLRVHMRMGNPQGYDGQEARAALGDEFMKKGRERAAMLVAAGRIEAEPGLPREGTIVHLRCDDERCEAFLDFRIRARKVESQGK